MHTDHKGLAIANEESPKVAHLKCIYRWPFVSRITENIQEREQLIISISVCFAGIIRIAAMYHNETGLDRKQA